jgi:aspartyl-tRNA(Asn)/glutamyl-tRNA(Gln) amidotransferase subunit B
VIGLEVHIQLRTESKLFCRCANRFGAEPNTLICPTCLGLPGALPALNRRAVELALRLALALGCEVEPRSVFARKNYFYPDMPKNYQISQYDRPLARGGALDIGEPGAPRPIPLERLHLEEDAGKSFHPERQGDRRESRVDFNRAGVPLVELVTRPALASPSEAHRFLALLRQLARALGITDGDMEKGSLRCDANVSVRRPGAGALGVKTEIKNLNSIRGVERGLAAEIARQEALLEAGGRVEQCTLLYDADRDELAVMRTKESAHDYRYLPEPDLPPLCVSPEQLDRVRAELPELPAARRARLGAAHGLTDAEAAGLVADHESADYFEGLLAAGVEPRTALHWVMGEVQRALRERRTGAAELARTLPPARLAALADLARRGVVSGGLAKELFARMLEEEGAPEALARAHGLLQESDPGELGRLAERVLAENADAVASLAAGRERSFEFLLGQLMRASRGKANPQVARELLAQALARRGAGPAPGPPSPAPGQ